MTRIEDGLKLMSYFYDCSPLLGSLFQTFLQLLNETSVKGKRTELSNGEEREGEREEMTGTGEQDEDRLFSGLGSDNVETPRDRVDRTHLGHADVRTEWAY